MDFIKLVHKHWWNGVLWFIGNLKEIEFDFHELAANIAFLINVFLFIGVILFLGIGGGILLGWIFT